MKRTQKSCLRALLLAVLLLIGSVITIGYLLLAPDWALHNGEIQPLLSEALRPTAEYLLLHPQTPPSGVDILPDLKEDVVSHYKEICFYLDKQGRRMELVLNGSRVPPVSYIFVYPIRHLDHPNSSLHCLTGPGGVWPSGLHLLELRLTRSGTLPLTEITEVYQWAIKIESKEQQ